MTDASGVDTAPMERAFQRHRRAASLIAIAVIVVASASVVYLRPTLTSELGRPNLSASPQAEVGPLTIPHVVAFPTPSFAVTPRSAGLVRPAAISVLIEKFGGLNDLPPLGLQGSVRTSDSTAISSLVRELNGLPAAPSGMMSCSMDDESYFEIVLTYADQTSTSVEVQATGCQFASIGASNPVVAWAAKSPELFDTLKGLLARKPGS
jgi:hypothetical protein